jgi:tRNA C32,U32 (ribose-2'-O)-methylase TrmJ
MYEHPYLSYQVTEFEREQLERAVERRRMLIERADQIVPRQAGALRRMLRRMLGRTGASVQPAAAPSIERRSPGSCEPLTAR